MKRERRNTSIIEIWAERDMIFDGEPKYVRMFAASAISIVACGFFVYQLTSNHGGSDEFLRFAVLLFAALGVGSFLIGMILLIFGRERRGRTVDVTQPNGGFWKFLALISGLSGLIYLISLLASK